MSRMVEVEVQHIINNVQVIDRTVNILNDQGKVVMECYELIITTDKTFNKARHDRFKNNIIKKLRNA